MFTYVGMSMTPADNTSQETQPIVSPLIAGLKAGDLLFASVAQGQYAPTRATHVVAGDGQSWNILPTLNVSTINVNLQQFWCQYTGSFPVLPTWIHDGGINPAFSAILMAFRPSAGSIVTLDQNQSLASFVGPSFPYAVTAPSQTPNALTSLTLASFWSGGVPTWASQTTGWATMGTPIQCRNIATTTGTKISGSLLYKIQSSATATGKVIQNQSLGAPGFTAVTTFTDAPPPPPPTFTPSGLLLLGVGH